MADKKNLRAIIRDARTTLRLAKKKDIDAHPMIEKQIMRVKGNIRHIRVEVKRLPPARLRA